MALYYVPSAVTSPVFKRLVVTMKVAYILPHAILMRLAVAVIEPLAVGVLALHRNSSEFDSNC
jgi:uncharacterized membrane protein